MNPRTNKQTVNKRRDGTFAPNNKLGNRFKKGETGNPNGRPKLTVLSEALRAQLAETLPGKPEATYAELIAKALVERAVNGDVMAAKEIADRTEGKAKQAISVDLSVMDWREMARSNGLSEDDVIREAKQLIEQSADD